MPVSKLKDASQERADFHRTRAAEWQVTYDAALEELKSQGIDVRQYDITGGQRVELVGDPSLLNRVNEAQGKVKSHGADAEKFDRWARAFMVTLEQPAGDFSLPLNADDLEYFNL